MKRFYNFCLFCAIFFLIPCGFAAAQEAREGAGNNGCVDTQPGVQRAANDSSRSSPLDANESSALTVVGTPQPPVRTFIPPVPPALNDTNARSGTAGTIKIVPQMPDSRSKKMYRIQVGSFSNTDLAWRSYDRLKIAGLSPAFEVHGKMFRVVIPGVQAANIPELTRCLETAGFSEAWVREEN